MNYGLFFDTETEKLPDFKAPSEAPHQPHVVQLAACLVDLDSRKTVASMDVIIRPDGWTIPAETTAIHGITTEHAMDVGIPEPLAISMFMELWADRLSIAHNHSFDQRILRIALLRYQTEAVADKWKAGKSVCTMRLADPIVALPPTEKMVRAGFTKNKPPNLGEAYRHFMGKDFENAHSAMADVQACVAVFFAIQDMQKEQAA